MAGTTTREVGEQEMVSVGPPKTGRVAEAKLFVVEARNSLNRSEISLVFQFAGVVYEFPADLVKKMKLASADITEAVKKASK